MRTLVTGATGYLGRHLVDRLVSAGHEVVALCRTDDGDLARQQGVIVRRGDVLEAGSVRDAAAGCEVVFHCAGKVSRRAEDAEDLYRIHVDGTKIALDACRAAGVRRAIVASTSGTCAVSRNADDVRDETAEAPMEILSGWPYYRSKVYAEKAALDRNGSDFHVVAVNPTLLLGPGDRHGSSTGDVVQFLERKIPFVPAGGMSFVDARDAADAMLLAVDKAKPGERYLLAAANMTIEAFFAKLERISGTPAPKLRLPKSLILARAGAGLMEAAAKKLHREPPVDRISAEMAQHFWYVDSTRARTVLGWTPRDPMDTLSDTIADLRDRGVVWPRD